MKITIAILTLVGFVATLSAGDLTGKITLKGTPPAEKLLPGIMDDPACGKTHAEKPKTAHYVVGSKGELANVVVVIKGVPGAKSTGPSAASAVLDQRNCIYVPQIIAVQTGQKITVKNSDPVPHNVRSTPISGMTPIGFMQMKGAPDQIISLDKTEDFLRFKCDVHNWMFAYATVVDHPYFAVTGADGTFKIANVPPGKYTVEAQHRKISGVVDANNAITGFKGITQEVEIKEDGGKADFEFTAPAK
jgi:plastocyanin